MGADRCDDCTTRAVMRCGRCNRTRCAAHALAPGARCPACERAWDDEAVTRRAAKLIFAPPSAILAGGGLFGALLPIAVGGAIGAAILCGIACATAALAASATCRLVDRSARALFLRERAGALPAARLLAGPRAALPARAPRGR
jgi:hypothetical protein